MILKSQAKEEKPKQIRVSLWLIAMFAVVAIGFSFLLFYKPPANDLPSYMSSKVKSSEVIEQPVQQTQQSQSFSTSNYSSPEQQIINMPTGQWFPIMIFLPIGIMFISIFLKAFWRFD